MSVPTFFRSDGWVKSVSGSAVPGAQIYVANQPANTAFLPPSPLATIYSDPNGLVPITQPILTDGFGHYDFYVLPGTYTVVVGINNQTSQVYPDQSIGQAGGSGVGTVTSVGLIDTSGFLTITNSPIISSGNISIAFATEPANKIFAGPSSGPNVIPTFRSLVLADLPSIGFSNLTGNISTSQMNSGTNASSSTFWRGDGTWALSGAAFNTAGTAYFPSASSVPGTQGFSGAALGSANQVIVYPIILDSTWTLSKIILTMSSTSVGNNVTCAIYNSAGNSILVNAGTNAFTTNSSSVQSVSITPVVLSPGFYLFGIGCTTGGLSTEMGVSFSSINAVKMVNNIGNFIATAANALSAGAMPSTLGTLTPITSGTSLAGVLFST